MNQPKSTPFFSIIVPVYQTEEFLSECLESIQKAGFEDFECLVILDGNNPEAKTIFDQVARDEPRFKFFIKSHSGVSDTRNFGIDKATGKFILFLDSDDFLYPDGLKTLYSQLLEYQPTWDKSLFFGSVHIPAFESSNHKNFQTSLVYLQNSIMEGPISRDTLGGLRFDPQLKYGEDCELLYRVYLQNRSDGNDLLFVTLNRDIIHYRYRPESANHNLSINQKMELSILVYRRILREAGLNLREKIICQLALWRCRLSIDLNPIKRVFRSLVVRLLKWLAGW
jgi:glycosyltransferase involved in cell wall biosynthesis